MRRVIVRAVAALVVGMMNVQGMLGQTERPPHTSARVGARPSGSIEPWSVESMFRVRLADAIEAGTVRKALVGAAHRLARGECQTIFSGFRDQGGRALADVLAGLGVDAPRFLTWLYFRDAPRQYCDGGRLAVTTPGSRVVFVCGRSFERSWRENVLYAEATLIHEMLHSLGLGENPPSSDEITDRVRLHCSAADSAARSSPR
jgi:hypothetical protein